MIVGIPKEIKTHEYRVGMIPVGVEELIRRGHQVIVEQDAGAGSGLSDDDYAQHDAKIVSTAAEVYATADMIVKVKEPLAAEFELIRKDQVLFTYFHFAADRVLTDKMLEIGMTAIAYETISDRNGRLPLLTPMSEVAGRMSVQEGAKYLERPMMGRGILLAGVPGVAPANVLILGGGVVGTNAAKIAAGLGANVVIMDISLDRLRYLDDIMPANVTCLMSDAHNIREYLALSDLVVGAVLIPGRRAPYLVHREDLKTMKPGAVIVDVAVDQGGCVETTRPTTHDEPTYIVDDIVHYCVANMPGAVGRTSTFALTNATMPYALKIADAGWQSAAAADPGLAMGVSCVAGKVTNKAVAECFEMPYEPAPLNEAS